MKFARHIKNSELRFYKMLKVILFLGMLCSYDASALQHSLPPSLSEEVLTESVPFVFAPNDFEASDFEVQWLGAPIPGVEISLGKESLQWVRTIDFLLLPRGRLLVKANDIEGGKVFNKGFTQAFALKAREGFAELPVALISGEKNPIHILIKRSQKDFAGTVVIRFRPQKNSSEPLVFTDHSCSPFKVKLMSGSLAPNQWVNIGCRLVYVYGQEHRTSSLEMFVYWDNFSEKVLVDGVETEPTSTSLWALRLRSSPGEVVLKSGNSEIKLQYRIAEKLHYSNWGMGIGPYLYTFESEDKNTHDTLVPYLTFYQSFFITEAMRVVGFGAMPVHSAFYSDLGIYLNSEYLKILDQRLLINIMLGAHVIGFKTLGETHFILGGPQGIEMTFRDFFKKSYNFSLGAFIYPPSSGKLYYNAWVRLGSSGFFGEFNYIAWQEVLPQGRIYSRSIGLSVGFPLFRVF